MRTKNLLFGMAIGLLALSSSCTKDGSTGATGATGPAGPAYTGAISGHVFLYDQYGSRVYNNLSTTAISLNGAAAVNPDVNGFYIFNGLSTGDYNITVANSGYGATQTNNFQYLADTLNKDLKLSALPDFSPTSVTVYTEPGVADSVVLTFNADTRARNCILFVNSASTVNNLPANYQISYVKAIAANKTSAFILIPSGDLSDIGVTASGVTIYCAAYGYVVGDVSVYEDLTTGRNVYNSVSATPQVFTAMTP